MDSYVYTVQARRKEDGTVALPTQAELLLRETVFHNANGYLGVRNCNEEGAPEGFTSIRGTYINGFYELIDMKQAEKLCGLTEDKQTMLNVTDLQSMRLKIDNEVFSVASGQVLESTRTLDMKKGVCERLVKWRSPSGREILIRIRRMASFARLSLFMIDYEVTALNFSGNVVFESGMNTVVSNFSDPDDPRVAGESSRYLFDKELTLGGDGTAFAVSKTGRSGLEICAAMSHRLFMDGKRLEDRRYKKPDRTRTGFLETISHGIEKGETFRVVKYCIYKDSAHHFGDLAGLARADLTAAVNAEPEVLYGEQEAYLKEFWSSTELSIEGDDELTLALHYNQYQLLQSVGKDDHSNIAAKGLSGEGYEGHFFWDTEMYLQPFFTLTNPELSKNLIAYRYRTLEYAKENAKILGHKKGALYPWRTIMGKECSGYFPAGTAQYHIDGDIVYSIVAYYLATKDLGFIADMGAEIVFECARLWMDVGNYVDGSFHINCVTGPDEYTCMVNNNYYTNASAKYNLHFAVVFYYLLKNAGLLDGLSDRIGLTEQEIAEFEKAEGAMYLPYDKELQINPQDDSFLSKPVWDIEGTPKENFPLLLHYHPLCLYRYQVCKQADTVLAHFIFEDMQSLDVVRNSFLYYEKITTHDSSLSTCIFSIMAAKLGFVDKAYAYLGDSAKLDLFDTHHNTKDGIHTANMGGTYMAVVYGFGGLRLKENGICFNPCIPGGWKSYTFTVRYLGSLIRVTVSGEQAEGVKESGTRTRFELVSGDPVRIDVYGRKYRLGEEGLEVVGE
ncbi:MAG: glycoside hydrolase family 65 protein [Lachnospiraceae bacterium]|nr:glycoside hydrolase family 65 protein [Lachnospiraceae bacterium]